MTDTTRYHCSDRCPGTWCPSYLWKERGVCDECRLRKEEPKKNPFSSLLTFLHLL